MKVNPEDTCIDDWSEKEILDFLGGKPWDTSSKKPWLPDMHRSFKALGLSADIKKFVRCFLNPDDFSWLQSKNLSTKLSAKQFKDLYHFLIKQNAWPQTQESDSFCKYLFTCIVTDSTINAEMALGHLAKCNREDARQILNIIKKHAQTLLSKTKICNLDNSELLLNEFVLCKAGTLPSYWQRKEISDWQRKEISERLLSYKKELTDDSGYHPLASSIDVIVYSTIVFNKKALLKALQSDPIIITIVGLNADQIIENVNLQGLDLSYADFSQTFFRKCNLSGCNLTGSTCHVAAFEKTNLSHANLSNISAEWITLNDVDLNATILTGADLSNGWLNKADFSSAKIQNSNLAGIHIGPQTNLKTNLQGCQIEDITFKSEGEAWNIDWNCNNLEQLLNLFQFVRHTDEEQRAIMLPDKNLVFIQQQVITLAEDQKFITVSQARKILFILKLKIKDNPKPGLFKHKSLERDFRSLIKKKKIMIKNTSLPDLGRQHHY